MEKIITGKNISLRLVNIEDAEFIVNLRTKKGAFLSTTSPDISKQKEWLLLYKEREKLKEEFYFIIENKIKNKIGTIRLYTINHNNKTFTFGSFIVDKECKNTHNLSALEAMFLIMNFAFEELLMKDCFFECRKDNAKANNFYTRFGSKIFGEENIDYLYNLSILDFVNIKKNINNILKY